MNYEPIPKNKIVSDTNPAIMEKYYDKNKNNFHVTWREYMENIQNPIELQSKYYYKVIKETIDTTDFWLNSKQLDFEERDYKKILFSPQDSHLLCIYEDGVSLIQDLHQNVFSLDEPVKTACWAPNGKAFCIAKKKLKF